ncbi:MAG: beta-N-acetylhexosaminidase, partial [Planctomycetes bacterium]|nr:beta-N-acetylhexosaminidase [Planctomycetota bacterium]
MLLVPAPQKLIKNTGSFNIAQQEIAISEEASQLPAVKHMLKGLHKQFGLKSVINTEKNNKRFLLTIGKPRKQAQSPKKNEAYALISDRQGISLHGHDSDGIYWALTTLRQLLGQGDQVPAVEIKDYPAFPLRYHHDDVSRKQISTAKDFKNIIKRLSHFKVKYYTPYMEDVLFLKSNPDIGKDRGRLMPNEIKAMLSEAKKHNVTVFPTYSLIGHQENLLQEKKYRKYAQEVFQEPSAYDPRKKILRPYLKNIIADVCELFPDAPYFHACFDEIIGLPTKVIIDHANWCAQEIAKHGKQMMMWIDMFKNHGAIQDIKKLDPSIILVEWNYQKTDGAIDSYIKHGYKISGLAGYSNWVQHLPNVKAGQDNIVHWAKTMKRLKGPGFGASMWGDNGYENSRALCWNLFAFMGEVSWLGKKGPKDFQQRFQHNFYGAVNKPLLRVVEEKAPARKIDPSSYFRYFRQPTTLFIRLFSQDSQLIKKLQADRKTLRSCLPLIEKATQQAMHNSEQIDNYRVAVRRELLIIERMLLAKRISNGLKGAALRKAIQQTISETKDVAKDYKRTWLSTNKTPNIEVSLSIYDFVIEDLQNLLVQYPNNDQQYEVDMNPVYNSFIPSVAGTPLGRRKINGVNFQFAPADKTHCSIAGKSTCSIALGDTALSDLHIIYGGQCDTNNNKKYMQINLYLGKKKVYSENFKGTDDLCN